MRVLGIDYGSKRVGVAISDELNILANPLTFFPAEPMDELIAAIETVVKEKSAGTIVVGMPRNMDGSFGPAAQEVRSFVEKLKEALPLAIQTWDERLTSVQANRVLLQGNVRRKERKLKVDQTAAAILLQSYLDSKSPLSSSLESDSET